MSRQRPSVPCVSTTTFFDDNKPLSAGRVMVCPRCSRRLVVAAWRPDPVICNCQSGDRNRYGLHISTMQEVILFISDDRLEADFDRYHFSRPQTCKVAKP